MKRGLLIALCLLLAVAVAPADAKKKHKKKKPINLGPVVTVTSQSNSTDTGGQEATATASCPAGLNAVSGGFKSEIKVGTAIVVHDSYMSSPTAWTVSARNLGGTGGVSATVYCRKTTKAPVTDVASSVLVNTVGGVGTATPTCPGTSRAISGGFQSTVGTNGSDMLFPKTSLLTSPATWTVSAINQESSDSFTLTAHAYCMSKIRPPTTLSTASSVPAVQYTATEAGTSPCPASPKLKKKKGKKGKKKRKQLPAQLLSAGGFSTPVSSLANPPQSVVSASLLGPLGGWTGSITNVTNGVGTISLTAQGICL